MAISLACIVLLVARIDLAGVGGALLAAAPAGIAVAVGLVCLEVALRARRWQTLLQVAGPVAYPRAVAYLCVGYFANSLLPARLGDLARAHLAGHRLGIGGLVTLGTIIIERLADAGTILGAVLVLGLLTPAAHDLVWPALLLLGIGTVTGGVTVGLLVGLRRLGRDLPPVIRLPLSLLVRIAQGGAALRSPRSFAVVASLTIAAFLVAAAEYWVVSGAVGLRLTLVEAALVMGALALSTSIPAAPGSLGTYELVGLAVLMQLGAPPAAAVASVVLMHLIATLPPALVGLAAFWRLHLRLATFAPAIAPDLVPA